MLKKIFVTKADNLKISFVRSIIGSAMSFLFDFTFLIIFVEIFQIYYIASAALSFMIGASINYFLAINWIFRSRKIANKKYEYLLFLAIGLFCLVLNIIFMWFFTEIIHIHYSISKIISAVLIFVINFTGRKIIIF